MSPNGRIPLLDLVLSLSDTIDLVSPRVANHHLEVAYIAGELAKECGLAAEQRAEILTAGALHDIGALSLKEKLANLQFELREPHGHARLSCRILKTFSSLSRQAELVRFHHVPWNGGQGSEFGGERVPLGSHILHLADRVSALKDGGGHILNQADAIKERIRGQSNRMFMPDIVGAFERLAEKQSFWLNAACQRIELPLSESVELPSLSLDGDELLSLAKLFARIIDFRSVQTATHSAGVGATARSLAELAGFSKTQCRRMEIAGYLHDLGKLAVAPEILEKRGQLTKEEFNVIFSHPFFTYRALQRIRGFGIVNVWASYHHERLNGKGYPYHLTAADLPLGARIVAVADVFTAMLEERPYQKSLSAESASRKIRRLADDSELDQELAVLLKFNLDKVESVRRNAQAAAAEEYREFRQGREKVL